MAPTTQPKNTARQLLFTSLDEQPSFVFGGSNPVHEGIHLLKAKRKEVETIEQLLDCVQEFEKMKITNGTLTKEMDTLKQKLAKQNDLTEKVKLENQHLHEQNKGLREKNKGLENKIDSLDAKLKDLKVPRAFHPGGLERITWWHCNGNNHHSHCNCGFGKTPASREEYTCCQKKGDTSGCERQCKVCEAMLPRDI